MYQILSALIAAIALLSSRQYITKLFRAKDPELTENVQKPIQVTILKVENSILPRYFKCSGTLTNRDFVKLKSERPGRVKFINQNAFCKTGDILIQLDNSSEKAQLTRATGAYTKAKDHLDRANERKKKDMVQVSSSELINYQSDYQTALGEMQKAQAELDKMTIVAPFDGKLGIPSVSIGTVVNTNDIIATYASNTDLIVDFVIPESALRDVYPGKKLTISSQLLGKLRECVVEKVDPSADATYVIKVRARVVDKTDIPEFCAGSSVTVSILVDTNQPVPNIDERALEEKSGIFIVYTIEKDSSGKLYAYRRAVEAKTRSNGRVEVNLPVGTMYCISKGLLTDGRQILDADTKPESNIIEEETAKAAKSSKESSDRSKTDGINDDIDALFDKSEGEE